MNKKGVTIVELVIYMTIFAILSLAIGRLFVLFVDSYSSGKRIVKQQTDIRDIMGLMVREIRNTGLKVYLTGTGPFTKVVADDIIINNTDSSSFDHGQSEYSEFGDTLKIKKILLNDKGEYVSSDTSITYYLDGTTLKWELKTTAGNPTTLTSVIAENVYALQFEYGIIASDSLLFDEDPISVHDWNLTCGGCTNPDINRSAEITLGFTAAATGNLRYDYGYKVKKNQKFRVILDLTPSGGFPDALDSLSIGFKANNTDLGSESFLPRSGTMEITVPIHTTDTSGNAYPTLEYAATGTGSLKINGIEAHCIQQDTYSWSFDPDIPDKKFVRAIRVHILTRTSGKTSIGTTGPITVGDVEVPRTGKYTWRLYTETIETPNNGVF